MTDMIDVDVLVIGAGVVGCSLALKLAQAGRRVRVLEQGDHVAPGASSLNAGLVCSSLSSFCNSDFRFLRHLKGGKKVCRAIEVLSSET